MLANKRNATKRLSCRSTRGIDSKKRRRRKVELLEKQDNKCYYCGCPLEYKTATLDHVVPRSKGGSNGVDNLVVACFPCNQEKADAVD